jgi:hypothetical protein
MYRPPIKMEQALEQMMERVLAIIIKKSQPRMDDNQEGCLVRRNEGLERSDGGLCRKKSK